MKYKKKIQIGIPCGRNSEHYVSFLINSIERTISNKYEYEYVLGVNQKGVNLNFINNFKNAKIVKNIDDKTLSLGHGACLDLIYHNMDADYGMFIDSDVAFICKNWDEILINKINSGIVMIGTEYHPNDGKIIDFPNVITCMFDIKKLKKINMLSFKPRLTNIIVDEENKDFYNQKPGSKIFLDTGCHIVEDFHKYKYRAEVMKIVSPRYKDRIELMKFMSLDMRGEEYQLDGVPITTHVGRSSSRDFHTDPVINSWRQRIKEWMG